MQLSDINDTKLVIKQKYLDVKADVKLEVEVDVELDVEVNYVVFGPRNNVKHNDFSNTLKE